MNPHPSLSTTTSEGNLNFTFLISSFLAQHDDCSVNTPSFAWNFLMRNERPSEASRKKYIIPMFSNNSKTNALLCHRLSWSPKMPVPQPPVSPPKRWEKSRRNYRKLFELSWWKLFTDLYLKTVRNSIAEPFFRTLAFWHKKQQF